MPDSDLKVTDRRWWARTEEPISAEEPKLKPKYVEELETQITEKNLEIQQLLSKYRGASDEFEQARARLRKELSRDVERGRRSMLVSFLEVLDNLDRALDAAANRPDDPFVQGVGWSASSSCRPWKAFGVTRVDPVGQPFDPARHEAVTTVAATANIPKVRSSASFGPAI